MKKFSLIYALSFLPFLAYEVCSFFNADTDKFQNSLGTLISVIIILEIPAFIYELIYIFKLGRKDNVSAVKSIGQFFLYILLSKSISVIMIYICIYFNGYAEYVNSSYMEIVNGSAGLVFTSGELMKYYGAEALNKYSLSYECPIQFLFITFFTDLRIFLSTCSTKNGLTTLPNSMNSL